MQFDDDEVPGAPCGAQPRTPGVRHHVGSRHVRALFIPVMGLLMADTTVLGRVNPVPAEQVSFNYGYETSVVLIWDRVSRMLVPLWSCC